MTMRFDDLDRRALRALDTDFAIDDSGEVATVAGEMKIELARTADDRLRLTIEFPGGEEFAVLLSRQRTLEQLNIGNVSP